MPSVTHGTVLWEPSPDRVARANVTRFTEWLRQSRGVSLSGYDELWNWSVEATEDFWQAVWEYYDIQTDSPPTAVLAREVMPGAEWFPGATLNFAQHMLRRSGDKTAIVFENESGQGRELSWNDLRAQVASVAALLRDLGVERGDRVVGFLPNLPETLVACLAATSLGAIWSCCSPDFGTASVVDRFEQIEPKVLFAVDGYPYQGKSHDRTQIVRELRERLRSIEHVIGVPYLEPDRSFDDMISWQEVIAKPAELTFEAVPFSHPLWILYSSGTTGPPKAIVQTHGGILLGLCAGIGLQYDIQESDRYFWFTTTGWAVWNVTVTGLLFGATVILYDGSPTFPGIERLWDVAERTGATWFGAGTPLFVNWMRAGLRPGADRDLAALRTVSVTGAPMPPEGFAWVYEAVRADVWFFSISGGTDSLVPLVAGSPTLPVRAGEIQRRALGVRVEAFDDDGKPLIGEVGELVITRPLPSMPLCFWGDPNNERLRESYFSTYPGIWRHGDWIRISSSGSVEVLGRSDATIKRSGVRIGSSEIYRVVEQLEEVVDSLVVDLSRPERLAHMILFVQLGSGERLTPDLVDRIRATIRSGLSPRHVPDEILAVDDLPKTLNNKKMEVPVKRILMGLPPREAANPGSMSNPDALAPFIKLADELGTRRDG